jgi:hypothetical protein
LPAEVLEDAGQACGGVGGLERGSSPIAQDREVAGVQGIVQRQKRGPDENDELLGIRHWGRRLRLSRSLHCGPRLLRRFRLLGLNGACCEHGGGEETKA